mmetsp:Transcript_31242/g.78405  ORF Transcript_31242/g.78405 Transcript_31242/m.78405 type:complete len:119 (+) Transcript_31242:145-501(+)
MPDHLAAFDLLHKSSGRFLPRAQLQTRCATTSIHVVPSLYDQPLTEESAREVESRLPSLLQTSVYSSGAELAEGLYIRVEDKEGVLARFKYRRKTFVCGREDFRTHIERNHLALEKAT